MKNKSATEKKRPKVKFERFDDKNRVTWTKTGFLLTNRMGGERFEQIGLYP